MKGRVHNNYAIIALDAKRCISEKQIRKKTKSKKTRSKLSARYLYTTPECVPNLAYFWKICKSQSSLVNKIKSIIAQFCYTRDLNTI